MYKIQIQVAQFKISQSLLANVFYHKKNAKNKNVSNVKMYRKKNAKKYEVLCYT